MNLKHKSSATKIILSLLFFSFVSLTTKADNIRDSLIHDDLQRYGETYIAVTFSSASQLRIFADRCIVDRIMDNHVILNVTEREFHSLAPYLYDYRYAGIDYRNNIEDIKKSTAKKSSWNVYPTYDEYDSIMHGFATQYPEQCSLFSIKTLTSGRSLYFVKLSDSVYVEKGAPRFVYISSMHGDETTGYMLMLRLIDYLLSGYGVDPEVTWLLKNIDIYINPLANPDGTYYSGNHTVSGARRRNANNVDLNRNYPDPEDGQHPDGNPWQEETIAFMAFADSVQGTVSANLHGGAEVANYPWDTWAKLHPDNDWWVDVCRRYADTVHAHAPSYVFDDLNNGITNGYAWYSISGGRQDYLNYYAYCRELTLEVSNTKLLPESQLDNYWNYHHRSLINYIKEAWYGMRGIVIDSITGDPVAGKIFAHLHDADSSHIYSDAATGKWFRPAYPSSYTLSFSASGYKTKTIQITAPPLDTIIVKVRLAPLPVSVKEQNIDVPLLRYCSIKKQITVVGIDNQRSQLQIFDLNGKLIDRATLFSDDDYNVGHLAKGNYIAHLMTSQQAGIVLKFIR